MTRRAPEVLSLRRMRLLAALALAAAVGLAAPACSKAKTYAIPQESRDVFAARCANCHGTSGRGDGPGAANLDVKPRNYTDPAWQKSVTDEQLRKIIVAGGFASGKSALMPPNPDLEDKAAVVEGLVGIVRSFAK